MPTKKTPSARSLHANSKVRPNDATVVSATPEALPSFPMVGLGASAGGLAAFEAFFSGMPADKEPGMAFVLVQHLAPDHKSILAELIRRYTRMQVFEVEDGMPVRINCAYIIPPNHDMALLNGSLQLLEPSEPRNQRRAIDFFFSSLAQDQRERAIGVVLSGTGSDGTLGARAIKDAGGMVMAQQPGSAEFDGMPSSAIACGMVDFTLLPAEMPAQLMAYARHAFGGAPRLTAPPTPRDESALKKVFVLLRAQTGHDFSGYKPGTVHRRIERRMAVHQVADVDGYVKYLQQNHAEVEALFRDLLIGVTHFFRDPEAFKVLEERAIAQLFENKPAGASVRVWVAGCSTGEEAYSIAILLQERMHALKTNPPVQVFATDLDSRSIAIARAGVYPASISADLTPERLARYFSPEPGGTGYRVHKSIRDMLVFSEQDVVKDPPFSKLDLISCRNLLIYLGPELQKRLLPLFHYALLPHGMLFLGSSEGVGEFNDLYTVLDRKAKLYQRREDFHGLQRAALSRALQTLPTVPTPSAVSGSLTAPPHHGGKTGGSGKLPLRELTEQALLQHMAVVGALINAQGDILYLHGRSGLYLELAPGEAGVLNILKMARDGLRAALSNALHQCAGTQEVVRIAKLRIKTNGNTAQVNLSVRPVAISQHSAAAPSDAQLYLVALQEATTPDTEPSPALTAASNLAEKTEVGVPALCPAYDAMAQIAALKDELRAKDEYLQSTREELESSNEELKSSNEEMQSVNEELQSTNEELETSKEELQSVNEELFTVNTELLTKVADLSRANNDMNNLLAGTGIATVFVDPYLRILRFTPSAALIINLIPSDVGRPVGHLVSNLVGYDQLVGDAKAVLDTLVPKDAQVQTIHGAWFTMRIRPYRTLDNVIEGVVITFVDVTDMKRIEQELEKVNTQLRQAATMPQA